MKKLLLVCLVSSVCCAFAEIDPVVGRASNTFGLVEVSGSSSSNTIISVPWMGYTTNGTEKVIPLRADQLVSPKGLTLGDMVLIPHNNGGTWKYAAWVLQESEVTPTIFEWKAIDTVTREDVLAEIMTHEQGETVSRGCGIWLVRSKPVNDKNEANPFYLIGQSYVSTKPVVTIVAGSKTSPCYTMLANPDASADTSLNDDSLNWKDYSSKIVKGTAGDSIVIPSDSGANKICRWDGTKWYMSTVVNSTPTKVYDITIPAGTGFWFVSRGGSFDFQW